MLFRFQPAIKGKIITTGWDPKTMTPPKTWQEDYDGGKIDGAVANSVIEGRAQKSNGDELQFQLQVLTSNIV